MHVEMWLCNMKRATSINTAAAGVWNQCRPDITPASYQCPIYIAPTDRSLLASLVIVMQTCAISQLDKWRDIPS